MRAKDSSTKKFFSQTSIAADFCNAFLYGGENVVKPEELQTQTPELLGLPKRMRDLLFLYTACTDGKATYLFLGMEFQGQPDRAMLFRTMEYDARQYCQQFKKAEPLRPVVTFVLNLSNRPWNYPTTVHEAFEGMDRRLRRFLPNYHINLVDFHRLSAKKRSRLATELRAVAEVFAHSREKRDILKDLATLAPNGCLSAEAVELLNAHLELQIPVNTDNKKEAVAMCEAMRFVEQKYTEKGEKKGRREGRAEGLKDGIKIGEEKNLEEIIRNALAMNLPTEIIQKLTGCSSRKIRAIERACGA